MAVFDWVATPAHGGCLTCGTSQNDKGFVNLHSEVTLRRDGFDTEITGFADLVLCADCMLQAARLVGAATPAETTAFAERELELVEENEKLKDEIKAWQERFLGMANLDIADFAKLAELEAQSKVITPPREG